MTHINRRATATTTNRLLPLKPAPLVLKNTMMRLPVPRSDQNEASRHHYLSGESYRGRPNTPYEKIATKKLFIFMRPSIRHLLLAMRLL